MTTRNWEELKKRTALYCIKCCPACGSDCLYEKAVGPAWSFVSCQSCGVLFGVSNPSYLKRKLKEKKTQK